MRIIILFGVFIISSTLLISAFISNGIEHMFLDDEYDFGCNIELPLKSSYLHPENKYPFNDSLLKYPNLVLYNQSPGIYDYRFCNYFESSGEIYIKAFEVTEGIQLSSKRLKSRSAVNVKKEDRLSCYGPTKGIKIYEGNGECKYVARFEVWFKEKGRFSDRKLFEKNYLITGWRR